MIIMPDFCSNSFMMRLQAQLRDMDLQVKFDKKKKIFFHSFVI